MHATPDPAVRDPGPFATTTLLAVFVGGVLGTLARVGLGRLFELSADPALQGSIGAGTSFTDPVLQATLLANLLGSFVLGVVNGAHVPSAHHWLRAGLGPGFCGAFTTFSFVALAMAAVELGTTWTWGLVLGGLLGGLLLAALGLLVGDRIGRPQPPARPFPAGADA